MLPLLAALACVSPAAFGAAPDDGRPDEVGLAAAIAEATARHAAVCLPAGVFELGRPARFASLVIDRGPVTLRGVGPRTILRMTGDGRQGDWRGVELRAGARGVVFEDLTLDSLGTTNTEEQTHLVQVSPGVREVTFRRVQLGPMRRPGQEVGQGSGGDCLRLVGEADAPVEDIVITRSAFVDCDRSGVSLQRGLRRITIATSTFTGTGDSPIDFEPTAPGAIEDVAMIGLRISRPAKAQGSWAIAIGGYGEDLATRITVADCVLDGGGIGMLNVGEVMILGNDIRHGLGAGPTISVRRRAETVLVQANSIARPRAAPAAALIEAQHNNGFAPTQLSIVDNRLQQETSAPVVSSVSVARLEVSGNAIEYSGDGGQFIIDSHAVAADTGRVRVLDNTIRGAASAALRLDARDRDVRGVELRGNVGDAVRESVACEAKPRGRIRTFTHGGNDFGAARSRCDAAVAAPSTKPPTPAPTP